MKHLSITLIAIFVASQTLLTAQTNLDQYKYVSVPNRFDFMKSSDQFQISSLAKFLLTKNKFTVLEDLEKYPADLAANQCLLLNLNVEQIKGFLKTKLEVQFLNCKNQVVFKSDIGMSREKDFKTWSMKKSHLKPYLTMLRSPMRFNILHTTKRGKYYELVKNQLELGK